MTRVGVDVCSDLASKWKATVAAKKLTDNKLSVLVLCIRFPSRPVCVQAERTEALKAQKEGEKQYRTIVAALKTLETEAKELHQVTLRAAADLIVDHRA